MTTAAGQPTISPGVGTLSLSWTFPQNYYASIVKWRKTGTPIWNQAMPQQATKTVLTGLDPVPYDLQMLLLGRPTVTDPAPMVVLKATDTPLAPPPPPPASTFLKGVTFNSDILVADPQSVTKQIAGLGVQWARVDLSWADVQPQGVYDWSGFDKVVSVAQANGLRLLPILGYFPGWATPVNVPEYAAFVAAAVQRYGPGTPANCPWFELWNEPTEAYSWGSTADPTAYAKLVQAAATAAKQASPTVKLTVYAVYDDSPQVSGPSQWRLSWIDGMFAAVPNFGSLVDAVAVHPYSGDPALPLADPVNGWKDASGEWAFARVDQIRRLFLEHGADLPVLVTELGWSTFTVTPALQAVYYHNLLAAVTARPWIRGLFPYTLREWRSHTSEPDDQSQFGLLSFPDWAAKPAYGALAQTFGGLK